jgi:hypothetical protein
MVFFQLDPNMASQNKNLAGPKVGRGVVIGLVHPCTVLRNYLAAR